MTPATAASGLLPAAGRANLPFVEEEEICMKLPQEQLERLALHSAFAVHQIARWVAMQDDVPNEIRDRLKTHMEAIEGVLVMNGHDWIKDEIEATEAALQA
jgi:hypothetical protein